MDLEIPALFKLFVQERKYLKNVTPQTIEWYGSSWKMLGSRFSECRNAADLAVAIPREIIAFRKERPGASEITVNSYARCVNAFFGWLAVEEHIPKRLKIPTLKERQQAKKILALPDVEKIKNHKPTGRNHCRVHMMALIALDCGLRLSEIIHLHKNDVDFDNLILKVMGKGRKERLVPMSIFLLKKLFRWVREHDGNLFETSNGSLLGVSNAQRDLRAMGRKCGVQVGFHQLRHTFATHYLRSGGSIAYLRRILGHSCLQTTLVYEHLVTQDLQDAHDAHSLLGKLR